MIIMRAVFVAAIFTILWASPYGVHANEIRPSEVHRDAKLAKELIFRFNDDFKKIAVIEESQMEGYKKAFIEYYREEAAPRLDHIADYIASDAHVFIDINGDGKEEFIVWSDGLRPAVWGANDFLAILSRGGGDWKVEEIVSFLGRASCTEVGVCRFAWSHYSPPYSYDDGGMLTVLSYIGAHGHSYLMLTLGWDRYLDKFTINWQSSNSPLVISK